MKKKDAFLICWVLIGLCLHVEAFGAKNLHFEIRNCDWQTAQFLGTSGEATAVVAGARKIAVSYFDRNGKLLFESEVADPLQIENPFTSHAVQRCHRQVSLPLPGSISDASALGFLEVRAPHEKMAQLRAPTWNLIRTAPPLLEPAFASGRLLPHRVVRLKTARPAANAWDLVILGDGFSAKELPLSSDTAVLRSSFGQKAKIAIEELLRHEPFRSLRNEINVWLVATPSPDSGISIPSQGVRRRGFFDSTMEAYCMSRFPAFGSALRVLEMASLVPFDQAIMLFNSNEYGGSGGPVPTVTVGLDSLFASTLVHELGHSVGHLADGYARLQDQSDTKNCPDARLSEALLSGFSQEDPLLPEVLLPGNLTNQPHQPRWAGQISHAQPIVRIARPQKWERVGSRKIRLHFDVPWAGAELLVFAGHTQAVQSSLYDLSKVWINGQTVPKQRESLPLTDTTGLVAPRAFLVFPWTFAPGPIELTLEYADPFSADYLESLLRSGFHPSFELVSRRFGLTEVGVVQGAYPDLNRVYRSSYGSLMTVLDSTFDNVEAGVLRDRMCRVFTPMTGSSCGL